MVMATDAVDAERSENDLLKLFKPFPEYKCVLIFLNVTCRHKMVDPAVLHERLVAHVRAVSGELNTQTGVWGEHSYARPRGPAADPQLRTLFAARAPTPDDHELLDVDGAPTAPPSPPLDRDERVDPDESDDDVDDEWEKRVAAMAPAPGHALLAGEAAAALRALRLERLAGRGGLWERRESARATARRLRRALAPHWASGAAWLHAALLAYLPRSLRPLYDETTEELQRAVPCLAERLALPRPEVPPVDPLDIVGDRRPASEPGPWLAWAPGGSEAEDARWVRRLGALLHVRELCPGAPPAPRSAPDRWCAALAHEARTALDDLLAEAGRRPVVLGGAGAGAALGVWLSAGGAAPRVRGLLLLSPPLLTAEGPRDAPDDVLEELDAPLLCVVGGAGAQCWRGAAAELCARGGRGEGAGGGRGEGAGGRRALLLSGADDELRVCRSLRRRLRLPQSALDAAVSEECLRWALEAAEAPPRERVRRKAGEDDRSMLGNRAIEIVEGRVSSRAPLELLPPRRAKRQDTHVAPHSATHCTISHSSTPHSAATHASPAEPLAAADIMQLPIVFADDDPLQAEAAGDAPAPLTVTSGHPRSGVTKYTRVIVAKRAGGGRGARTVRRRPPRAPLDR